MLPSSDVYDTNGCSSLTLLCLIKGLRLSDISEMAWLFFSIAGPGQRRGINIWT
jgi:hypothetical protein